MNLLRGKAGMDEATMSGLRERVHSGFPLPIPFLPPKGEADIPNITPSFIQRGD